MAQELRECGFGDLNGVPVSTSSVRHNRYAGETAPEENIDGSWSLACDG